MGEEYWNVDSDTRWSGSNMDQCHALVIASDRGWALGESFRFLSLSLDALILQEPLFLRSPIVPQGSLWRIPHLLRGQIPLYTILGLWHSTNNKKLIEMSMETIFSARFYVLPMVAIYQAVA